MAHSLPASRLRKSHRAKSRSLVISGVDGDEAFCLRLIRFQPGQLLVGNSVQSMGFFGGMAAGLRNFLGGESRHITEAIKSGRDAALQRMASEATQVSADGVCGVTSELKFFVGQLEFLTTGSALTRLASAEKNFFTASLDGKELFCVTDAGYQPQKFAFGNIAYSMGVGAGLIGSFKSLARGEIKEFSQVLNATRHAALDRLVQDAALGGANAVLGVEVDVMRFIGFHEMLMTGTAAFHPQLNAVVGTQVISCELMCDELWSVSKMGYVPIQVVMGSAVYSLGVAGGLIAFVRGLSRGEVPELTSLIYDAREHALDLLEDQAKACRADAVMGTDVYIQELGSGLVEFMAIGTAVRKVDGDLAKWFAAASPSLPAQARAVPRNTFRQLNIARPQGQDPRF